MKRSKVWAILLSAAMIFAMFPGAVFADTEGADAKTDTGQFADMPSDWSAEALQNAVANGLISGYDENGQKLIKPDGTLTRAEMGTIINNAFGASEKASLTGVKDVAQSAWYYDQMAKAVQMGSFAASSELRPEAAITRQEVATVLAKVFRLPEAKASALDAFTDKGAVASWAQGFAAAMAESGYMSGSNGKLNPAANITRAEFAAIMNNMVAQYIRQPGTYTEVAAKGNVMVNAADVTLKNVTVNGDLILGDGVGAGNVTLDSVKVTGRTVVRGGGVNSVIIKGTSDLGEVIVSKVGGNVRVSVQGNAGVSVITVNDGKNDVIIEGTVDKLVLDAAVPVITRSAEIKTVEINQSGSELTVEKGSKVATVSVAEEAEKASVSVAGTVTTLNTAAPKTEIAVSGTVNKVVAEKTAESTKVTTESTAKVDSVVTFAPKTEVSGKGNVAKVEAKEGAHNSTVTVPGASVTVDKDTEGVKAGTGSNTEVKPGGSATVPGTSGSTGGGGGGGGGHGGGTQAKIYAVTSEGALKTALSQAAAGDTIRLDESFAVTDKVTVNKALTLNLNGKTLTTAYKGTVTDAAFDVASGGNLTLTDSASGGKLTSSNSMALLRAQAGGTINVNSGSYELTESTKDESRVIRNEGTLNMTGGTVKSERNSSAPALNNRDGSKLTLSGGTVDSVYGIGMFGKCSVTISGTAAVKSTGIAVSGNGQKPFEGYTLTINGGTITSEDTAIYLPSAGITRITAGNISGKEIGIGIRAGELTVSGGTVTASAARNAEGQLESGKSGVLTGALVVGKPASTSEDGYVGAVKVKLDGGSFINESGDAVVNDKRHFSEQVTVTVADSVTISGKYVVITGEKTFTEVITDTAKLKEALNKAVAAAIPGINSTIASYGAISFDQSAGTVDVSVKDTAKDLGAIAADILSPVLAVVKDYNHGEIKTLTINSQNIELGSSQESAQIVAAVQAALPGAGKLDDIIGKTLSLKLTAKTAADVSYSVDYTMSFGSTQDALNKLAAAMATAVNAKMTNYASLSLSDTTLNVKITNGDTTVSKVFGDIAEPLVTQLTANKCVKSMTVNGETLALDGPLNAAQLETFVKACDLLGNNTLDGTTKISQLDGKNVTVAVKAADEKEYNYTVSFSVTQ